MSLLEAGGASDDPNKSDEVKERIGRLKNPHLCIEQREKGFKHGGQMEPQRPSQQPPTSMRAKN